MKTSESRSVCVVGLGYIGLPTAAVLASHGFAVVGFDTNPAVIAEVAAGRSGIVEPGLDTVVDGAVRSGSLQAVDHPVPADIFIVAVPTPIRNNRTADLDMVVRAARSIGDVLKRGDLVILESTVPPGTTGGIFRTTLEESGLVAGRDFFVAHCPERVLPGNLMQELTTNDRIVGGIDEPSTRKAAEIYQTFVNGAIIQTDAATAELVKLMENTYRDVNIALANEFALIAEQLGADVWEAINYANLHPRVNYLRPGPGVGGHCIAVDPWFVVESAGGLAKLISTAREVNDAMPDHVVALARRALGDLAGAHIGALGLTYKANVADVRESPAVDVVERLQSAGAIVRTHDPFVKASESVTETVRGAALVVLLVDHASYKQLDPRQIGESMKSRIIIDTRGAIDRSTWERAGFRVHCLGRADGSVLVGEET